MFYELAFRTRKAGFQLICLPSLYLYKNTTSLSPSDVKSHIGSPFILLHETDSTNRYARNQLDVQGAAHGAVYFAHHQSQGRGRQERAWISEPGKNILMSVVLNTLGRQNEEAPQLNQLVALACFDLFSRHAGSGATIKWPNDIYWGDRKAGGILIENCWRGAQWTWAIVGIGMNINQTAYPEQASRATSLQLITGRSFEPIELAKELCGLLENRLQDWSTEKRAKTLAAYNMRLYKKDQPVTLLVNGEQVRCIPLEVNAAGELLIKNDDDTVLALRQAQWTY